MKGVNKAVWGKRKMLKHLYNRSPAPNRYKFVYQRLDTRVSSKIIRKFMDKWDRDSWEVALSINNNNLLESSIHRKVAGDIKRNMTSAWTRTRIFR